ncbi:MAG: LysE family translocator [Rhodoferax sp.]|nr:LysE family translocator [Rhodoferax sp.]
MLVSSVTPGPNNTMLMASGVHFGFRRTLAHLMGVQLGFGFMVVAVGLGLHTVLAQFPAFYDLVRFAGAAYMVWMAWSLASARPHVAVLAALDDGLHSAQDEAKPLGFWGAVLFQWVNPKAWVMAVTIMSAYVPPGAGLLQIAPLGMLYVALGFPCSSVWVGFGSALRSYLQDPFRMRVFNCSMAAALLLSLYPMLSG